MILWFSSQKNVPTISQVGNSASWYCQGTWKWVRLRVLDESTFFERKTPAELKGCRTQSTSKHGTWSLKLMDSDMTLTKFTRFQKNTEIPWNTWNFESCKCKAPWQWLAVWHIFLARLQRYRRCWPQTATPNPCRSWITWSFEALASEACNYFCFCFLSFTS